jgi:hypothetical protein
MNPLSADAPEMQNKSLFETLCGAKPHLLGVASAVDALPGFHRKLVLHAGPPIGWDAMQPAMQAAIVGALVFEGLAPDLEAAQKLAASEIEYASAHDRRAAGAMAGIVTASMPVFVVEDEVSGERAYATINEGLGKTLRFGANGPDVLKRLTWIRDAFAPLLNRALTAHGPIDLRLMIAEALRRGDECHNRNKAATTQFFREIAPDLVLTGAPHAEIAAALRFIAGNDHFFLNISMAHAKAVMLSVERRQIGSLVTTMAGNGRDVGIRVSGTGSRWFTAPAEVAAVRLFEGHSIEDATPTMGDSYITEALGLGAFALSAAPAIAEFVGGTVAELTARSEEMRKITVGEHPVFLIPALGFRGVPSGIDVHRVAQTGLAPVVNTGVASRRPGVGQIGAGMQSLPLRCFTDAAGALTAS